jgi:ribosomal protein S18 acetylase RimI-like enzyme
VRATDRARAEVNLRAALSLFADRSPGAVVQECEGVLLVVSAAPVTGAFHAAAVRVVPGTPPGTVLDAAGWFAARHRRGVTVWAAEDRDADLVDALARAGLPEQAATVGMARSVPAVGVPPATRVDGVELRPVTTPADVGAFADVHRCNVTAAGRSPTAVDHYATPGALTDPAVDAVVARAGGVPVAGAMALTTGSVVGVYWVVTHPDHRRRGLGRAVTVAVARASVARGADLLVLQATAMGVPLYRSLGFVPFTTYRRWLVASA